MMVFGGHSIINGNKHVSKVYYVEYDGELTEEGIQCIKEGIVLGDGPIASLL